MKSLLRHAAERLGIGPRQRRILVDSRTPVNTEMVLPIVRAMSADTRVTFAFTASEEPRRVREIHAALPLGSHLVDPRWAALHKWDVYLTSDFMWLPLPRGTARVQMFHGVAGKYGFDAPTESLRCWDRLFFINERRLRNVVASGALTAGEGGARVIGMPKLDSLVDGSLQADRLIDALGLTPGLPTVLYAPTWSPESSLNRMGIDLVERLRTLPINLVIKLHDRSCDPRVQYSGGVDWRARLAPLLVARRVLLYDLPNVVPCLAVADLMVTDHSSAGFEYLLRDRPIVRLDLPALIALARVHPDYVSLLAGVSINVGTAAAAAGAVIDALPSSNRGSPARRRVAEELFYRPGTATMRAVQELYDLLELVPHPACLKRPASQPCAQLA